MKTIIEVENLTKKYGTFKAVDDISFEGYEGDIVAFLGPNGAGKTTTMRILCGYMPATEGTARIGGYDIFDDSMQVRQMIGYLPELPPLYPDMTVQSYLKFVAQIKQVEDNQIKKKVDQSIEQCGLKEIRDRLIYKLSRGLKQRVGIAQAIIHDPKVIILDEPTVGLDPNQVIEIRELIRQMAENKTVLLSTHILSEAEALCKHVVIINKGKIVARGAWEDMQQLKEQLMLKVIIKELNPETLTLMRNLDYINSVEQLDDSTLKLSCPLNSDARKKLIKFFAENNFDFDQIETVKMSLEELFKNLTLKEGE